MRGAVMTDTQRSEMARVGRPLRRLSKGCDQFDVSCSRAGHAAQKAAQRHGAPEGRPGGRFRSSHSSPPRSAGRVELFRFSGVVSGFMKATMRQL
jgi:hypothetical protein